MSKQLPKLRVLYIPESLNVVKDNLRLMNDMAWVTSRFNDEDAMVLYVENEKFLRGDKHVLFTDFEPFFKDDEWVLTHQDDVNKEIAKLEFKKNDTEVKPEEYLNCEVYFNGVTLFIVQTNTQQHEDLHCFMDKVLANISYRLPIKDIVFTEIFKRFSLPYKLSL